MLGFQAYTIAPSSPTMALIRCGDTIKSLIIHMHDTILGVAISVDGATERLTI